MVHVKKSALALALCAALVPSAAFAGVNDQPAEAPAAAGAALDTNEGHFLCTAAITAAGGVFSGQYVNGPLTGQLSTGTYQVAFNAPCPNVQLANGWFRVCQIDTLTTGEATGYCTVADRAGVPSGIFVATFNSAGAPTNLPFTLSVSR